MFEYIKCKEIFIYLEKIFTFAKSNPKVLLMEKRIGTIAILITDKAKIQEVNAILSEFSDIILARQGLPFKERNIAVISLIIESETNRINALSGKLGKLSGVETKSIVTKSSSENT